jgi:hypothetical protein
MMVMTSSSV